MTHNRSYLTLVLCFAVAMLEGADIISMGLAAPALARVFGFYPQQIATILSAAVLGMMAGAIIGGRAGDRFGRKRILLTAVAAIAFFSLATTQATTFRGFVLVRFLCGLGLGGALPNLIAIVTENVRGPARTTPVGIMLAGQPVGGSLLGLFVASQGHALDWRTIFYMGGALPLVILPALLLLLPESAAFLAAGRRLEGSDDTRRRPPILAALFGEGRGTVTILLWFSYGFTQVVVYLINNWLPSLMVAKGFGTQEAALISAFENLGGAAGCVLLALIVDSGRLRHVIVMTYIMMIVSLLALASATTFPAVVTAGTMTGFFVVGGQLTLYAIAPRYYPTLVRATGVGSAVSVGRLGAIAGPLAAGNLLSLGMSSAGVLAAAAPCLIIAGGAVAILVARPRPLADGPIEEMT